MPSIMRAANPQPRPLIRRSFPLKAAVAYRLIEGDGTVRAGRTQSLSGNKVWFEAENCLLVSALIELEVDWPVRLDNRTPLKLVISGRTLQVDQNHAAVEILRHEFRTRSVASEVDPAAAEAGPARRTGRPVA